MKYKDFKMLSIDDMKQIMGGNAHDDKPCVKCCTDKEGTDCSECSTGLSCNSNAYTIACPQNPDGTCKV